MSVCTFFGWPGWITPITSVAILTVWIVYLREMKNYQFRALLYSAVVLATFALYNTQEDSFGGILTTYCAAVVVLSIQTAGRDLLFMISDVLDFSELESGKMALVEESAAAVVYLAGDKAAYTTGQLLTVSGGFGLTPPVYGICPIKSSGGKAETARWIPLEIPSGSFRFSRQQRFLFLVF